MTHHNDVRGSAPAQHDAGQGLGVRMRTAGRRLGAALRRPFVRVHRSDSGASAVEYGLLVAAIAAVVVVVVFALGGLVKDKFDNTCAQIAKNGQASSSDHCPTPAP